MDAATINLWLSQAEHDDVISPGFRPQVERKMLEMAEEISRLTQWVHDCQAGMYINCVYCGHRYGPDDEVKATMQQALYDHIAVCPKHPLSKAIKERDEAREDAKRRLDQIEQLREAESSLLKMVVKLEDERDEAREAAKRFLRIFANDEQRTRAAEEYPWTFDA